MGILYLCLHSLTLPAKHILSKPQIVRSMGSNLHTAVTVSHSAAAGRSLLPKVQQRSRHKPFYDNHHHVRVSAAPRICELFNTCSFSWFFSFFFLFVVVITVALSHRGVNYTFQPQIKSLMMPHCAFCDFPFLLLPWRFSSLKLSTAIVVMI